MKRVLAFLLAFYVLALTLEPCVDHEVSCTGVQQSVQETGTADHESDHKDLCSPFCTCNCCSVTMEVASSLILAGTPVAFTTLPYFFKSQPTSTFLSPVWEPPKA